MASNSELLLPCQGDLGLFLQGCALHIAIVSWEHMYPVLCMCRNYIVQLLLMTVPFLLVLSIPGTTEQSSMRGQLKHMPPYFACEALKILADFIELQLQL